LLKQKVCPLPQGERGNTLITFGVRKVVFFFFLTRGKGGETSIIPDARGAVFPLSPCGRGKPRALLVAGEGVLTGDFWKC
jgi:hypothetical protein